MMEKKVIEAVYEARQVFINAPLRDDTVLGAMVQVGINTLWDDFNPNQKKSWPKETGWYVACDREFNFLGSVFFDVDMAEIERNRMREEVADGWFWDDVAHYTKPDALTPKPNVLKTHKNT